MGNRLMGNIMAANLEAWFQMIRDNQFEGDAEMAETEKEMAANDEGSE